MKIAIIGAGAMGSIYAARFARAGHEVWAVDLWQQHVEAINRDGLTVDGPDGRIQTRQVTAVLDLAQAAGCQLYVIATKASGVADAAQTIAPLLRAGDQVVTIQNGLGAGARIAEHLPSEQVLLGVAEGFGAAMVGPGRAQHTSMKRIRLGRMDGGLDAGLEQLVAVWQSAGFDAQAYADIEQLIWEKLLCNVTLSGPCTVFGCQVSDLMADEQRWARALGCMLEAYAVGQARGVRFSFDDPVAYVTDFAKRVGTAKPSMLQDHEARRPSELDAINGAIPPLARSLGIASPHNDAICAEIRAREAAFV